MSPTMRTLVFVGILGGFTMFSTLMLDSLTLLEKGSVTATMVNLFGQLLIGFLLVWVRSVWACGRDGPDNPGIKA
jgi:fluoride ion exporter CrcB/FEX